MYRRNFKRYWKEHMAHIAVGYLIGLTFNVPLAMLVCKRQDLEYQKRDDTPGIDLAYHVGAATAGTLTLMALLAWRFL